MPAFSTGVSSPQSCEVEFSDGPHLVPAWIVAHLGGVAGLMSPESLAQLAVVTYQEFVQVFHETVSSDALSKIGQAVVNDHLRLLRESGRKI